MTTTNLNASVPVSLMARLRQLHKNLNRRNDKVYNFSEAVVQVLLAGLETVEKEMKHG